MSNVKEKELKVKMDKIYKCGAVSPSSINLVRLALVVAILNIQQPHVALGQELVSRFAQVQPFDDDAQLLADRIQRRPMAPSEYFPCLGDVARLDTLARAHMSPNDPTEFHVYTPGRGTRGIEFRGNSPQKITGRPRNPARDFQYNLETMAASGFDVAASRTVVMIPGYLNKEQAGWALSAKDLWLQLCQEEGVNVIVVTWPASQTGYSQAVADTVFVARQVVVFLHYLAQLGGTNLRDLDFLHRIHLVGHSLGAHIAGFVGQDLGGRVGRITGLDPAGPSFDNYALDQRLNRNQAQLVEILHSNAGQMRYFNAVAGVFFDRILTWLTGSRPDESGSWFGINQQLGHVDYHANNGRTQEACMDPLHSCDHKRATEIYVDLLRREVELRTGSRSGNHIGGDKRRLWAFQARNYDTFETGAQFDRLCSEVMQLETHLDPKQVAKNFANCAVPLMDFWTPLGKLTRELRDVYGANFDPNARAERQPRYYFKTQMNSKVDMKQPELLGNPYLLKVYLDSNLTAWNPEKCALGADLQMADGELVKIELSNLAAGQSILAMPLAHPAGHKAHADLHDLLTRLQDLKQTGQERDKIAALLRQLFPTRVDLKITAHGGWLAAPTCQVALRGVEVHAVSTSSSLNNVGFASRRQTTQNWATENQLEVVSIGEFAKQLASLPTRVVSNKSPAPSKISETLGTLVVVEDRHETH